MQPVLFSALTINHRHPKPLGKWMLGYRATPCSRDGDVAQAALLRPRLRIAASLLYRRLIYIDIDIGTWVS